MRESKIIDFTILGSSSRSVLVECSSGEAKKLASRCGGIFKVARICGSDLQTLSKEIPLPDDSKFNWTVSGYGCSSEILESMKDAVSTALKNASLGKARFIHPETGAAEIELQLSELIKNVLSDGEGKRSKGLDIIADCSQGTVHFGFTEFTSNLSGLRERDLSRPYKDPTVTLGPRLARTLANLCALRPGSTVLDPFCGLGTILQEALMLGYNALGAEISSTEATRCRENLEWLRKRFQISPKLWSRVIRKDAFDLQTSDLPKIDAVVTEPILMPLLERNPTAGDSEKLIHETSEKYSKAFETFSRILEPGGLVSIVAPQLVDDRGKAHSFDLVTIAEAFGFRLVQPKESGVQNPCSVLTSKRKIIQRRVYLLELR
jgi:hypothetical protein